MPYLQRQVCYREAELCDDDVVGVLVDAADVLEDGVAEGGVGGLGELGERSLQGKRRE